METIKRICALISVSVVFLCGCAPDEYVSVRYNNLNATDSRHFRYFLDTIKVPERHFGFSNEDCDSMTSKDFGGHTTDSKTSYYCYLLNEMLWSNKDTAADEPIMIGTYDWYTKPSQYENTDNYKSHAKYMGDIYLSDSIVSSLYMSLSNSIFHSDTTVYLANYLNGDIKSVAMVGDICDFAEVSVDRVFKYDAATKSIWTVCRRVDYDLSSDKARKRYSKSVLTVTPDGKIHVRERKLMFLLYKLCRRRLTR